MQKTTPWMVRMVQWASVLFVLLGGLSLFVYTPFYSNMMVGLLNQIVAIEMNQVAAQSQQSAKLTEQDSLEPGSELWIARQAYLKLLEQSLNQNEAEQIDLKLLQLRYQQLQQKIETELAATQAEKPQETVVIPLLADESASVAVEQSSEQIRALLDMDSAENKELMQQYLEFLKHHPIELMPASEITLEFDPALEGMPQSKNPNSAADAYAIVVLGGGLTLAENGKDIVVNDYTRLRLEKTLALKKQYDLPIVLSGVEAPYMQEWLKHYQVDARLLENRSMNTCENTRFSALLLQKKGGAPKVMLVTDRYHMPRTRRLFALNGIETIPVEAPMPTAMTSWQPSEQNYHHSRRANYELLASLRDIWFGSSDCREVP